MGIVSFRPYGRMGNFLFMAAACISYAIKHGLDFSIPYKTTDPFWNPLYLSHLINPNYQQGREDVLINENGHEYKEIEWREEWRNKYVILNGYFQSWKYIDKYSNEILYLFDYPYDKKENYVSVHVRRTDYTKLLDKHPQIGKDWYDNAMSKFGSNFKFKFFSDDIGWCREQFGNRTDCEFSTNDNEERDLIEASCCEHNISSSSTFSWWIAWLNRNPNKIVYIPKDWFVPGYHLDTKDIVPLSWYKL